MNNNINGIILVNKEKNWTSNDIVSKVKHLLNEKVGHIGTLDPNATGILPLLIGNGTKLSKYLIEHDKEYIATISLGKKSDTGDVEGKIIEEKEVSSLIFENDNEKIKSTLSSFLGKQSQIPPIYSAIKVKGKKLYEYAREGKEVELKPRDIEIYSIELLEVDCSKNEIKFKVHCSKGTYIRSLCEDISEKLGTVGHIKDLERITVGKFNIKDSYKISDIEKSAQNSDFSFVIETKKFIKDYLKIGELEISNSLMYNKYFNGVGIYLDRLVESQKYDDGIYIVKHNGEITGIGKVTNNILRRDIVL